VLTFVASAPVLHLVNETNVVVTEGSPVVICYEVFADGYLLSEPKVSFNGSEARRWYRLYYEDNGGKIGREIQNITFVHHFFICLKTLHRFHHTYDDGTYAVKIHNECGSTTSSVHLKGIALKKKFD